MSGYGGDHMHPDSPTARRLDQGELGYNAAMDESLKLLRQRHDYLMQREEEFQARCQQATIERAEVDNLRAVIEGLDKGIARRETFFSDQGDTQAPMPHYDPETMLRRG